MPASATSGPNCNGTQVCDSRGECGARPLPTALQGTAPVSQSSADQLLNTDAACNCNSRSPYAPALPCLLLSGTAVVCHLDCSRCAWDRSISEENPWQQISSLRIATCAKLSCAALAAQASSTRSASQCRGPRSCRTGRRRAPTTASPGTRTTMCALPALSCMIRVFRRLSLCSSCDTRHVSALTQGEATQLKKWGLSLGWGCAQGPIHFLSYDSEVPYEVGTPQYECAPRCPPRSSGLRACRARVYAMGMPQYACHPAAHQHSSGLSMQG